MVFLLINSMSVHSITFSKYKKKSKKEEIEKEEIVSPT